MRAVLLLALGAGCYSPAAAPGAPCGSHGECPSNLECRNDLCVVPGGDGDGGALPDVAIDAAIDACPAATCMGNQIVGCGAPVTCDTGCSEQGGVHCRVLVPSNQITTGLLAGATANVTGDKWDFDTETGRIKFGNTELRAPGPGVIGGIGFVVIDGVAVFSAHSFTLGPADDWSAGGTNAIALFAATTITIDGTFDVGADSVNPGPDGGNGTTSTSGSLCRGRAGALLGTQLGEGGGGGGGRTAGGDGGPSTAPTITGLGGTLCPTRSSTIPLNGGAGGGAGGASSANAGGNGGGAIALVAMQGISVTGVIGAPGSGGVVATNGDGGGGGGAGGAVLLEAPVVTVSGALTANGGGGGAPTTTDGARGAMASNVPANGGSYTGPGGTRTGGKGGAGAQPPTSGQNYSYDDGLLTPTSVFSRGGGGGGAAGRIEIKSLTRDTTNALISPTPDFTSATLE